MKVSFSVFILTGALGLAVLTGGQLPEKHSQVVVPPLTAFQREGTTADGWGWTTARWTDDDEPYQAIVNKIEANLGHGVKIHSIVTAYQAQEKFHSQDPLAVFAWGAAKWRSCCLGSNIVASDRDISMLPGELAAVTPQPHDFNWVRLRFLVQAEESPQPELQSVGERLLARRPTDRDVQWQLILVLRRSTDAPQINEAIKISQALVAENPKEMLYRQMLANRLEDRWMDCGHKTSDAEAAVAAYQYYVDHALPGDPVTPNIIHAIALLKKDETLDWTPVRTALHPAKPLAPPRIYEDDRPRPHKPASFPKGPGEPMPPPPLQPSEMP